MNPSRPPLVITLRCLHCGKISSYSLHEMVTATPAVPNANGDLPPGATEADLARAHQAVVEEMGAPDEAAKLAVRDRAKRDIHAAHGVALRPPATGREQDLGDASRRPPATDLGTLAPKYACAHGCSCLAYKAKRGERGYCTCGHPKSWHTADGTKGDGPKRGRRRRSPARGNADLLARVNRRLSGDEAPADSEPRATEPAAPSAKGGRRQAASRDRSPLEAARPQGGGESQTLNGCQLAILRCLYEQGSDADARLSRTEIGIRTGYFVDTGAFSGNVRDLRQQGLITADGVPLGLLGPGEVIAEGAPPLARGPALAELWAQKLGAMASTVLAVCVAAAPQLLARSELEERTGFAASGGAFNKSVRKLRHAGLLLRGRTYEVAPSYLRALGERSAAQA